MNEEKREERARWLEAEGRKESDVMSDDDGDYIIGDDSEGQDEEGNVEITPGKKVYLPEDIQEE